MYQHGKKTKAPRNMAVFLATVGMVGVVILVAWWMIHNDVGSGANPKTTVPIVTEIGEDKGAKFKVDETLFTFELPEDWKFVEHMQGNSINAYVYMSTKKGGDDRKLTVHVDTMPSVYKIVKLQPLRPNGSKFSLGNLSAECVNFAGSADRQGNDEFQAKWENVTFICDPITANQTIGTGTVEGGIAASLSGSKGTHRYFFYFEDHNVRPEDKIFRDALQSFQAR